MPALQQTPFETCTPGEYGTASYVIEGNSCVIFHLTSRPYSVNAYMNDVIEAIRKKERVVRVGQPALQFFELQVRKNSRDYEKGKFFFMMVWEYVKGSQTSSNLSWHEVRCPTWFVQKYAEYIGAPPVQCVDEHYETFGMYLEESRKPKEFISYSYLEGLPVRAWSCKLLPGHVTFGTPGYEPDTWEIIQTVTEKSAATEERYTKENLLVGVEMQREKNEAYWHLLNYKTG